MTPDDVHAIAPRWRQAVAEWSLWRDADPVRARAHLQRLLDGHLLDLDETSEDTDLEAEVLALCEEALIDLSGEFDEVGYAEANRQVPALREGRMTPLEHFCTVGWEWLRNPRSDFDLWWYWFEHLDPRRAEINPFVHYLLVGRHLGLATRATSRPERPDAPTAHEGVTRRICLFAAYDVDGVVDDYVVHYLRELSRHADVFYLADGRMKDSELAKLRGVTKGAWAVSHGRYDFGSFAILANELVGWDIIDTYDELLFANDSCYLLRPLDEVFARMDPLSTDWWGLQGTKADFDERYGHTQPIPFVEAKHLTTEHDDWNCYFRLHLSSYFLVFRKRVMNDPGFRSRLNTVSSQPHKMMVVLKYEIGLSDYLLRSGFGCETFIPDLYPFHPIYSRDYFKLLELGFPLLKRNLINENALRVPDLAQWRERVGRFAPDAPFDVFESNLRRVSSADSLAASLAVHTRPDGSVDHHRPLGRRKFRALDRATPTFEHWWAFPVCADEHTLTGNERAVFEAVADDPAVKKIILTRSRAIALAGENIVTVPIASPEGQYYLARSGQIFLKHGPLVDILPWQVSVTSRNFINLSQGTPLRRFGTSSDHATFEQVLRNNGGNRAVISAGPLDRLAMAASFFPVPYDDVWQTGLPRHDFMVRAEEHLAPDMRAAIAQLREEVGDRPLVLLVPGSRAVDATPGMQFTDEDAAHVGAWAEQNGVVLGIREPHSDRGRLFAQFIDHGAVELGVRRYPDFEVLLRVADAMISDHSASLIDFSLTGQPIVCFDVDPDQQRLYELERMLPGRTCRNAEELMDALATLFEPYPDCDAEEYRWRRDLFAPMVDGQAAWRVVQRVKSLYLNGALSR